MSYKVLMLDSADSPFHADPEDIAEKYALNLLDDGQAEAYEEHLLSCSQCINVLDSVTKYIAAVRAISESSEDPTAPRDNVIPFPGRPKALGS